MNAHLSMEELMLAALTGASPPHAAACAFCSEQLALVRELAAFEDGVQETAYEREYRLAAATGTDRSQFTLRRTWYLEGSAGLVRVLEDTEHAQLVGYLVAPDARPASVRIRFSGIENEFIPGGDGSFVIGPATIDIESMDVSIRTEP